MESDTSPGILTLGNFYERLPRWSPSLTNHLFALVDMGSNGIRFSISDLSPPKTRLLRCVYRDRASISLFDALNTGTDGNSSAADQGLLFPPQTISLVAQTLSRFRHIADSFGVPIEHFSVLATEAMRRASNAKDMLAAIHTAAGVGVHVLDPGVETLFGAVMGSRSAFVDVSRGGLFLDLGGGSVQMTWVDTRLPEYEVAAATAGVSMPFGAARLIRMLEGPSINEQTAQKATLRARMKEAFVQLLREFPSLDESYRAAAQAEGAGEQSGIDIYMCGGGFRGYGHMLMYNDSIQPYPIPSVGAYTVSGKYFKQSAEMRRMNADCQDKIYGMSNRRRQQFPAIAEVVEAFIETVPHIRTVTFCAGSNRDGALLMKLPRELRESNPLDALGNVTSDQRPILRAVENLLADSVPSNLNISAVPTILSLGLCPLFFKHIWRRLGEESDANAAHALHQAVTKDPSAPGLTHLARAVLGLTSCARWSLSLGPVDAQLHDNLKRLAASADEAAVFWSEYFGTVASILVNIVPALPASPSTVTDSIKFVATQDETKKGNARINLTISVSSSASKGINLEDLIKRLKKIEKKKQSGETSSFKIKAEVLVRG